MHKIILEKRINSIFKITKELSLAKIIVHGVNGLIDEAFEIIRKTENVYGLDQAFLEKYSTKDIMEYLAYTVGNVYEVLSEGWLKNYLLEEMIEFILDSIYDEEYVYSEGTFTLW